LLLMLALPAAGCGLSPNGTAAASVAADFHRAVARGDGQGACGLLAESVRQELESDGGSCGEQVLHQDLPAADGPGVTSSYGLGAQVRLGGDVVFLSSATGRWLITAAGCVAQPVRPYQCRITGG
jgi:hypothetical protein